MATDEIMALNPADHLQAAQTLARAFQHDPGTSYIFTDEIERANALPAFFTPMVAYGLAHGAVEVIGRPAQAVAIWLPPERPAPDPDVLAQMGMEEAVANWSAPTRERADLLGGALERTRERLMPLPHARLFFLGVEPASQGRGLGGALIEPMLRIYRERNIACYLETLQASNVAFYERRGFRTLEEEMLPGTSIRVWAMRTE